MPKTYLHPPAPVKTGSFPYDDNKPFNEVVKNENQAMDAAVRAAQGGQSDAESTKRAPSKSYPPTITDKGEKKDTVDENNADLYYITSLNKPKSADEQFFEYQGDDFRPKLADLTPKPETIANIRIIAPLSDGEREEKDPNAVEPLQIVGLPFKNLLEPPFTKFFLQAVNEVDKETVQIVRTFSEPYFNFFGREPRIYEFRGGLMNTKYHDWKNEFYKVYDEQLRGTKLAEQNAKAYITYDDILVEGYPFSCTISLLAQNPKVVPFSIIMIVTHRAPLKGKAAPTKFDVLTNEDIKEIPDDIFKVVQDYIQFNKPLCLAKKKEIE